MNPVIKNRIEERLDSRIVEISSLSGGCINEAYRITAENRSLYFLKVNAPSKMFFNEANGLKELKKAGAVRVPEVIFADDEYILTEYVEQGRHPKDFFEKFGYSFALMHKYTSGEFGFYEDNFIGSTPQINLPGPDEQKSWVKFYFNKRLLFQFLLAVKNGYADASFRNAFKNIENKIESILSGSENIPSVLHGDLWSGNFMCGSDGEAYIIDPAVYYGNREADLAMTKLFGGFSSEFYLNYNQTYPLPDGYEYRENIYKLYHVMNHLNLFGSGYYHQAISLMKFY